MKRLLVAALLLATACGGSSASPGTRHLTVLAASSLTEAFGTLAADYDRAHPGTKVDLSFAGSPSLVAQVQQGIPADVLATADQASMGKVAAHLTGPPRVFARNRLAIVFGPGRRYASLRDLARPGTTLVIGAPSVPVGKATRKALAAAGVSVHPVSLEPDVKAVLTKVVTGEADVGVVYATDLAAAGSRVRGVVLPGVVTTLPIGTLTAAGRGFADYVLSPAGRAVLARYGFVLP